MTYDSSGIVYPSEDDVVYLESVKKMNEKIKKASRRPLVVNMFAGPGCGKSTVSASVFGLLKLHGVNSELITEFAKDLAWEQRTKTFENQYYIWAKQYHKLWRVGDQVDVVITDSPFLLSLVYGENKPESFKNLVREIFDEFNNVNYYLIRVKPYEQAGRNQDEEEAKELDESVFTMLKENQAEFGLAEGSYKGVNVIVSYLLNELGIERKYYISEGDSLAKD